MAKMNWVDMKRAEVLGWVFKVSDEFWQWNNRELAEEAGVSQSTVSKLRRQVVDCRTSTMLKLVKAVELELYVQQPARQQKRRAG